MRRLVNSNAFSQSIYLLLSKPTIETDRLLLRQWLDSDLEPFAAMNADLRVMEYYPNTLTNNESDELAKRIIQHFDEHEFGLWAVEIKDLEHFAGFIGLSTPRFEAHFTPCVEIGWRLAGNHWGNGYATEGALAALKFAFEIAELNEIVSMTSAINQRSRRVMERIGMTHSPSDDFDHPMLPEGHALSRHVLYRIANEAG